MASTEAGPAGTASGSVRAFLALTRPVFLLGAALLYLLGAVSAVRFAAVEFRIGWYLLGQVMVTATQLTAQYLNERFDVETDRRNRNRTLLSGGSGVLASGRLSPSVATRAAWVAAAVAVAAGGALAMRSPASAAIGVVALFGSWAYSAPPVRLVATPFGEIVATAIVVGMVPVVGALLQAGAVPADLLVALGLLAPVHGAMLLAFSQPDIAADDATGKATIAVRVGERTTAWLQAALVVAAAVAAAVVVGSGAVPGAAWALLGAPAGAVQLWAAWRRRYALLTVAATASFALAVLGLLFGLG